MYYGYDNGSVVNRVTFSKHFCLKMVVRPKHLAVIWIIIVKTYDSNVA
jgi:hypothetical protein